MTFSPNTAPAMKRRTFIQTSLAAAAGVLIWRRDATASLYRPVRASDRDVVAITGDGAEVTLSSQTLADLARRLQGRLLLAEDDGYDDARRIINPSFDKYPALIAQVSGTADVQTAVAFARDNGGLLLAVKCGGHSLSGKSTCDRGMVIDLSPFRGVHVDIKARRARVTGGSLLGAVDHETVSHGLVTPLGTVSHTGVGGLVTGGGFGRLARRYGLSIDNVISVDVVTADGQLRHANESDHRDLFWGVRGGGGNFGIVTRFEFGLHPIERQVLAGDVVFPMSRAGDVLSLFADYGPVAPDELQLDAFLSLPPGGDDPVAGFKVCYSGVPGEAEQALAPIRGIHGALADTVQAMDYTAVQRSGDFDDPRALGMYTKSGFLRDIPQRLIEVITGALEGHPARSTTLFIPSSGGAINRVASDATALPQRNMLGNMLCLVGWRHGDDPSEHIRWIQRFWTEIEPFTDGFYVNDLEVEHTYAAIQDNYRRNHARLVAVKDRYDPTNLFRLNANIQPSAQIR